MDDPFSEFLRKLFAEVEHLSLEARHEALMAMIVDTLRAMDTKRIEGLRAQYVKLATQLPASFSLEEDSVLNLIDGHLALREIDPSCGL